MISRVRTSIVLVHENKLLAFLAEDPTSKKIFHFLPGGLIEANETAPEAAIRETFEETGFRVHVDPHSCVDKEYEFFWDGNHFLSLTFFYRAYLQSPFQTPGVVSDAPYHRGVVWIPIHEIPVYFDYHNTILEAITEVLQKENESR